MRKFSITGAHRHLTMGSSDSMVKNSRVGPAASGDGLVGALTFRFVNPELLNFVKVR